MCVHNTADLHLVKLTQGKAHISNNKQTAKTDFSKSEVNVLSEKLLCLVSIFYLKCLSHKLPTHSPMLEKNPISTLTSLTQSETLVTSRSLSFASKFWTALNKCQCKQNQLWAFKAVLFLCSNILELWLLMCAFILACIILFSYLIGVLVNAFNMKQLTIVEADPLKCALAFLVMWHRNTCRIRMFFQNYIIFMNVLWKF